MIRKSMAGIFSVLVVAGCAQEQVEPRRLIVEHGVTSIEQLPKGVNAIDKRDLSRIDMGVSSVSERRITARAVTSALGARDARVANIENGFIVTLPERQFFDHPQSKIESAAMPGITRLAAAMLRDPSVRLDVVSHYHSDGLPAKALAESQKRAVAIQAALMSRGVPAHRIRAVGGGERTPVATNFDPAGQMANRRIDLIFMK